MLRPLAPFAPLVALFLLVFAGCSEPVPAPETLPASLKTLETPPPTKDGPFIVTQTLPNPYRPGEANTASFTMDYRGSEPVTALALQVKLPVAWQFVALTEGDKPAIVPKAESSDQLTFVWITAPEFPATLTYTLSVPEWAEGTYALEAQAIYRCLGGELHSKPHRVESTFRP